jgi:hypothetical protein
MVEPIRQASGELRSVAQMWAIYRAMVLPAAAPPIQVSECRRAFYAGVQSALMDGLIGIGDDANSEEACMAHLTALHEECQQFARDVTARKA